MIKDLWQQFLCSQRMQTMARLLVTIILVGISYEALADGQDILKGTAGDAVATAKGTGKTFLYLGEFVASLVAYIKTKNVLALFGVLVIALFINIVFAKFITS